jgi:hypothetical protein
MAKNIKSFGEHSKNENLDLSDVSRSSVYKSVLKTLRNNKVMVKTENDGIYIRLAGNEGEGECFSLDWAKVISF